MNTMMDIFNGDAFSMVSLTGTLQRCPTFRLFSAISVCSRPIT
jgi:hypothetical protein